MRDACAYAYSCTRPSEWSSVVASLRRARVLQERWASVLQEGFWLCTSARKRTRQKVRAPQKYEHTQMFHSVARLTPHSLLRETPPADRGRGFSGRARAEVVHDDAAHRVELLPGLAVCLSACLLACRYLDTLREGAERCRMYTL